MTDPRAITDVNDHEVAYLQVVMRYGTPGPVAIRFAPEPLVTDDGETDCWTHAWEVAERLGATYVEGTCRRAGYYGPSMHAWVQEDTPFGPRIIECTPGYEHSSEYLGIAIDNSPGGMVQDLTEDWGRPRSSVLQAALLSGIEAGAPIDYILTTVRA